MTSTERTSDSRPRMVLAHRHAGLAEAGSRHFHRLGWEVHPTGSGVGARRLARALAPAVVVLETELEDESGWLTCAKLTQERPGQRVILVDPSPSLERVRLASFVGADALVAQELGLSGLVDEVLGMDRLCKPA